MTYKEIHVASGMPAKLPDACPVCGAHVASVDNAGKPWERKEYACGGAYSSKDQIQSHTDKWCGSCGDGGTWSSSV